MNEEETPKSPQEKLDINDESLRLATKPKRSWIKKLYLSLIIGLVVLIFISYVISFFPAKNKQETNKSDLFNGDNPKELQESENDYGSYTDLPDKENSNFLLKANEKDYHQAHKEKDLSTTSITHGYAQGAGNPTFSSPVLVSDFFGNSSSPVRANMGEGNKEERTALTDYERQNQQKSKIEFMQSRSHDYSDYIAIPASMALSPGNEIKAGTYIPIIMQTAINSDLPGPVIARVVNNVRDSIFYQRVLIPRGSHVIGDYDSSVAFGQERVLIAWNRIIRPDGVSISLERMSAADLSGMVGIKDKVDNHYSEILAGIGVATTFEVAQKSLDALLSMIPGNQVGNNNFVIGGQGKTVSDEVMKAYLEKVLNKQPTLVIEEGTRGNIIVNKDLIIPDWITE